MALEVHKSVKVLQKSPMARLRMVSFRQVGTQSVPFIGPQAHVRPLTHSVKPLQGSPMVVVLGATQIPLEMEQTPERH